MFSDNSTTEDKFPILKKKGNWEWLQCVYDIKRITNESEITWNLSPTITLNLPSEVKIFFSNIKKKKKK